MRLHSRVAAIAAISAILGAAHTVAHAQGVFPSRMAGPNEQREECWLARTLPSREGGTRSDNGGRVVPRETRAVWLTTLSGLDWPSTPATTPAGREAQKRELTRILDIYQQAHINTVLFQTRVRGAVIYPSSLEPWDDSLTGRPGGDPGYDPLAFCIEECHKRGMELHAWVVCIPLGTTRRQRAHGAASVARTRPELVKTTRGGEMFMIPGHPGTAAHIASLCREIAAHYDVDGISLDYIRYPEKTYGFSDDEFRPKNQMRDINDWRRENINRIVRAIHDSVKSIKPWVRLSSSPVGKYASTARYSAGGWDCLNAVWQDPKLWLREGWQDMLFPMMYYRENNYYPFLFDWLEGASGHPVVPGLGIYFLHPSEGTWRLSDVLGQMHAAQQSGIGGIAFFRSKFLTDNTRGVLDAVREELFTHPVLTQRMTWQPDTIPPSAPSGLIRVEGFLRWDAPPHTSTHPHDYLTYCIYASRSWPVDTADPANLIVTRVRGTQYPLSFHRHYAVTAVDRFGNESEAVQEPENLRDFRKGWFY